MDGRIWRLNFLHIFQINNFWLKISAQYYDSFAFNTFVGNRCFESKLYSMFEIVWQKLYRVCSSLSYSLTEHLLSDSDDEKESTFQKNLTWLQWHIPKAPEVYDSYQARRLTKMHGQRRSWPLFCGASEDLEPRFSSWSWCFTKLLMEDNA